MSSASDCCQISESVDSHSHCVSRPEPVLQADERSRSLVMCPGEQVLSGIINVLPRGQSFPREARTNGVEKANTRMIVTCRVSPETSVSTNRLLYSHFQAYAVPSRSGVSTGFLCVFNTTPPSHLSSHRWFLRTKRRGTGPVLFILAPLSCQQV